MIKFRLRCGNGHEYDSMFNSGDAFDKLQASKKLACELCGDKRIEKGIMAPAIRSSEKAQRIADMDAVEAPVPVPFVGELLPVYEAADEGDPVAKDILSRPAIGTSSSEADTEKLMEYGAIPVGFVNDENLPPTIEHEETPAKKSNARRPSTKPKTKKAAVKKTAKRHLN